jgi:sterol desaturase/sphingolipid hydroxylase (fatty acid hydroxylase superfamily)
VATVVTAPARPRAPLPPERDGRATARARDSRRDRSARGTQRATRALSTRVYLPACAVAAFALLLIGAGWALGWGDASFTDSAFALRVVVAGPAALAIIGLFLVIERLRPAQVRPVIARGHRQDALYAALHMTILVPLVTALTLSFVAVARETMPWIVLPHLGTVPRWGAIAVIVVAMDACNWAVHLANHRVRMLWRFHELHHSQEDMSTLTVFRTHPLIHVSYLLAVIPAVVLLANGAMTTTILVVYGSMVAFAHSNTRLGFGPLERIFVSPNFHRIHHQLDGPQDVNLGFVLTVWDQLSGRAMYPTEATIRTDTGLPGRPLVVEQEGPRARHLAVLFAQLVAPFRPMHVKTDLPPSRSALAASGPAEPGHHLERSAS